MITALPLQTPRGAARSALGDYVADRLPKAGGGGVDARFLCARTVIMQNELQRSLRRPAFWRAALSLREFLEETRDLRYEEVS